MFQKSSTVAIKDITGTGEVAGVAWSFVDAPDRQGDHILPSAFDRHSGDLPIKVEHKGDPVGRWHQYELSDTAFSVQGQIDRTTREGKNTISRARDGDLRSLSIGFSGSYQKSGKERIFTDLQLTEISLVQQPANAGSRVVAVKSLTDCTKISDFQKTLKRQLGISNAQAKHIASLVWPTFHDEQPDDDFVDILSQFSLRY